MFDYIGFCISALTATTRLGTVISLSYCCHIVTKDKDIILFMIPFPHRFLTSIITKIWTEIYVDDVVW
jgi:hypothetical protein